MRHPDYPLTRARMLAPEAFRRWLTGGISVAVLGYSAFAVLDVQAGGIEALTSSRHVLLAAINALALIIAIRVDEVTGIAMAMIATWCEVLSSFYIATSFPSEGMLVLPVLVLASGLLLGSRVGFGSAVATIATTYLCFQLSPAGRNGLPPDSDYWFLTFGVSMLAAWTLLALGLSGFTRVFDAMVSSRKELADTIRFTPDGILVVDPQGVILIANPAAERLLRADGTALVGSPFADVMTTLVEEDGTLQALARADADCAGDVLLHFTGDPVTHVEASWRSMDNGRRQLLLRDVTQRVSAEEQRTEMESQLAHAQRMDAVGRLAGGLSHDFNNILTAVSGSAELLREARDETDRHELIDEIISARDRGTSLTRQLLSFARRDVRQPEVMDIADALHGMERLLARVGGERLELVLDVPPDCHVYVDCGQFEQTVVNLVANARDAMLPAGGICRISVRQQPHEDGTEHVVLQVRDTGAGMSDSVAARAFEPFFTTKPRGQGTGLGLASVHAMVTQSNGTARIVSTPGLGTCITIELPAATGPVRDGALPLPTPPAAANGTHRILVAEDDSGTRRVVERLLTSAGYSVQLCADGREAMAAIDAPAVTIDLVLSDIMMPGYTGPEVAARVAEVRPGTPVLLMTGYAENVRDGVLSHGARHEVIMKPFSGSALTSRIAEMINSAQTAST